MTGAAPDEAQWTIRLTAHPLQRVGAFALTAMADADVNSPEDLSPRSVQEQAEVLLKDVEATATVAKAQDPGGFWLGVSYQMWPNSKMNTTSRSKQSPEERGEKIREWRAFPDRESWPDAPCALCGHPASGFYGVVDVPLWASAEYRNTTPRGHNGLALCFSCLTCFRALPYGCLIGGGWLAALHSWDDDFLAFVTEMQVRRTARQAAISTGKPAFESYFREVAALRGLRGYEERVTSDVELLVFSNFNGKQFLDVHRMDQPLAEWLRRTIRADSGYRFLVRAHWSKDTPGTARLARNVFHNPPQILRQTVAYLTDRPKDEMNGGPLLRGETAQLVPLCLNYAVEVLDVRDNDRRQLATLAGNIANVIEQTREKGALKGFEAAYRDAGRLRHWLRRAAIAWALQEGGSTDPFITDSQWLLLFDSDSRNRLHQDLLLIMLLEQLARRGWAADDVSGREDLEDALTSEEEPE